MQSFKFSKSDRRVSNGEKPSFVHEQERNRLKEVAARMLWNLIEAYQKLDGIESPNENIVLLKQSLMGLIIETSNRNSISKYPSPFNLM